MATDSVLKSIRLIVNYIKPRHSGRVSYLKRRILTLHEICCPPFSVLFSTSIFAQAPSSAEFYIEKPTATEASLKCDLATFDVCNVSGQSEVTYVHFFIANTDKLQLKQELDNNIAALFTPAEANQSIQCRFPGTFKMAHRTTEYCIKPTA